MYRPIGAHYNVTDRNKAEEQSQGLVLDRIRTAFGTMPHAHRSGILCGNFGAGPAVQADYAHATELIAAADDAFLRAKREGRNRLLLAGVA